MSKLFERTYTLHVGDALGVLGHDFSDFEFDFHVKKSLTRDPNTCQIQIYNLSEESRFFLEIPKKLVVKLEVGYKIAGTTQIFLGEVRYGQTTYSPSGDVITEISSGDSEKEMATARINASYGPKVPASVVLQEIVSALGIGQGNVATAAALLASKGIATLHPRSTAIEGNAARAMDDFCHAAGLEWSVQDGAIQILNLGGVLEGPLAIKLSPDTGLIGSPTVDSKGVLECQCLIIPNLRPGVRIQIDSRTVKGFFRITHCEYVGQNYGNDWGCTIKAEKF